MKTFLRDQWISFYTSLGFLTRIPVPGGGDPAYLDRSAKWSSVVGLIVGGIAASMFATAHFVLPASVSIVLAMAVTAYVTGGFHEDGFADSCDAFGGGYTKEDVLRIMKDSRIGSFGALGLFLLLLLKYAALTSLLGASYSSNLRWIATALIVGHATARFWSISFLRTHVYVRDDSGARAKPMAVKMDVGPFLFALAFTMVVVFGMVLALGPMSLGALLPPLVARLFIGRLMQRRIGGYTGDVLGMAEQATEAAFYVGLSAVAGLSGLTDPMGAEGLMPISGSTDLFGLSGFGLSEWLKMLLPR